MINFSINKKYLKINETTIVAIVLLVIGISFFVFNPYKQDKEVVDYEKVLSHDPCRFKYLPMLVGYDTRGYFTTQEQQKECSLQELQSAHSIEITETQVGDIPLSAIKDYARIPFAGSIDDDWSSGWVREQYETCLEKEATNPNTVLQRCSIEIDLRLKEVIKSLVVTLNNYWQSKSILIVKGDINIEQVKSDWNDWYISENYTDNLKAKTCTIESVQPWGASRTAQGLRFSDCIIKHDAIEILWLLERFKDVDNLVEIYTSNY